MTNWRNTLVRPDATVRDAIVAIDSSALQIALVVQEDLRLLGTITDGDIRRGILRGAALEEPATKVMNPLPTVAKDSDSVADIRRLMELRSLHQVPVVDDEYRVTRLVTLSGLLKPERIENAVVLMAGGLGRRLGALTRNCPKPMLKIGGKPLLQTIVENFRAQGFYRFFLSVNYLSEVIKSHFGDGKSFGAEIQYIDEPVRLGTAGALGLLPQKPDLPLVVMNADLLTNMNFRQMLDFHEAQGSVATIGVREYTFQIPYGVIHADQSRLKSIQEKPTQRYFINAGAYVLDPAVVDLIKPGEPLDMPDLVEQILGQAGISSIYPIREYWLDVGRVEDFDRAEGDFADMFATTTIQGQT